MTAALDTTQDSYGIALHVGEKAAAALRASRPPEPAPLPDVLADASREHLLAVRSILLHARSTLSEAWTSYDFTDPPHMRATLDAIQGTTRG